MFMPPYGGVNYPYKTNLNWLIDKIKELDVTLDDNVSNYFNSDNFKKLLSETVTGIINNQNAIRTTGIIGRKFIFISDSYGINPSSTENWISYTAQFLGLDTTDYYSNAVNGARFNQTDPGQPNFISVLQDLEAEINDKDSITDIIVLGGYNDRNADVEAIKDGIGIFTSYAKSKFKYATISIIHAAMSTNYNDRLSLYSQSYPAYATCSDKGALYISGCEMGLHSKSYLRDDGLHPSALGSRALARKVANAIAYGTRSTIGYETEHYTLSENITSNMDVEVQVDLFTTITLFNTTFNFTTPIQLRFGLQTVICSFNNIIFGGNQNLTSYPVVGTITDNSNKRYDFIGLYQFNNGQLTLQYYGNETINNVVSIQTTPINMQFIGYMI